MLPFTAPHFEVACGRVVFSTLSAHSLCCSPCIYIFQPSIPEAPRSIPPDISDDLLKTLFITFVYLFSVCGSLELTWRTEDNLREPILFSLPLYGSWESNLCRKSLIASGLTQGANLPNVYQFLLFGHGGTEVKKSWTALGPRQSLKIVS